MNDLKSVFLFWKSVHRYYSNFIDKNHVYEFDEVFFDGVYNLKSCLIDKVFKDMCHCLNDAHTNVYNKNRVSTKNYGLNVRCCDSKFIVIGTSDKLKNDIPIGSEILKINGDSLSKIVDDNLKNVTYSRLDHGISKTLNFIFSDQCYQSLNLTFLDQNSTEKIIKLEKLYDKKDFSPYCSIPLFTPKLNLFDKNVSYVYLSSFSDHNEVHDILKELRKLQKTSKLIIDIRGNSGGNGLLAMELLSSITNKKLDGPYWRALSFNAFYNAWFHNMDIKQNIANSFDWSVGQSKAVFPDQPINVEKVCVLVDCDTISAAEDFLLYAKQIDYCSLIGETTAGSSGLPINLDLGENYWCQITVKHDFINHPNDFIRVGIAPNYIVHHTPDQLRKNIDSPLQFALDLI